MALETRLETKMEHKSLRDNRIFTNSLVVILGVTWGLAFVAIRTADFQLSPINLTLLRWHNSICWSSWSTHFTGTYLCRGPFGTVPQGEDREETHARAGSSYDRGN